MINNDWDKELEIIFNSDGFKKFLNLIKQEYINKTIYPSIDNIFNALKLTPFSKVKVVIVGQDPYHGENEAHGLSFSVNDNIPIPPSLKNIFKELNNDLHIEPPKSGNLTKWAQEGVLLLNSVLTVVKDSPGSHQKIGWQAFTDYIIKTIDQKKDHIVFILWGNYAKEKKNLITNPTNYVISSTHPSPFSARNGFFGSKPFSKTNNYLKKNNIKEIDFSL